MANDNSNKGLASADEQTRHEVAQKGGQASPDGGRKSEEYHSDINRGGNSNQGFGSMDEEELRETASKGGQSQGQENNPGNFANRPQEEVEEAAKRGGEH